MRHERLVFAGLAALRSARGGPASDSSAPPTVKVAAPRFPVGPRVGRFYRAHCSRPKGTNSRRGKISSLPGPRPTRMWSPSTTFQIREINRSGPPGRHSSSVCCSARRVASPSPEPPSHKLR
jgi:hypothetical protein